MLRLRTFTIFLLGITTLLLACKHESEVLPTDKPQDIVPVDYGTNLADTIETPCSDDSVYFINDIFPLITSRCAMSGCHNEPSESNRNIDLTSYSEIMHSVEAGYPNDSELWEAINATEDDDIMPRPGYVPLTSAEKSLIEQWITQGAKNNVCKRCNETLTFSADIQPIIRNNCYGCHSENNPDGNLTLSNYTQISNAAARIVSRIDGYGGIMPPQSNGIPTCEKEQIKSWIEAGKPNN